MPRMIFLLLLYNPNNNLHRNPNLQEEEHLSYTHYRKLNLLTHQGSLNFALKKNFERSITLNFNF